MIHNILKSLESTNSRNEKIKILEQNFDNELLKRVLSLTYDKMYTFFISDIEAPDRFTSKYNLEYALEYALEYLIDNQNRLVRGDKLKDDLYEISKNLSYHDFEVFSKVINRDLRIGVGASSINKVWKNLIFVPPYMRCSSYSDKNLSKINFPAYSQSKSDGLFCNIVVNNGNVQYISRNGSYLPFHNDLDDKLVKLGNYVLLGEALALDEYGHILDRKDGNGYLNSDDIDTNRVIFHLWDMIPYDDWIGGLCLIPYSDRLNQLSIAQYELNQHNMILIDTKIVNNTSDVLGHFKTIVSDGGEGTVLKNMDSIWKDYTSPNNVKIKIIFDCEVEIVDYKEGTGKHSNMLGAFVCKSKCGQLTVNVGSGYSDQDRLKFYKNPESYIGKILTVRANDVISNVDNTYSLFLPRFVEIRTDKDEADNLETILETKNKSILCMG